MEADRYEAIQEAWLLGLHRHLEGGPLRAVSVFDHENLLITLLASAERAESKAWDEWLASALGSLDPGAGVRIYGGASAVYEDLGETADRCAQAVRLLALHVLDGRRVLTADYGEAAMSGRTLPGFDITETVQGLVSAFFKQDREEVRRTVEDLFRFAGNRVICCRKFGTCMRNCSRCSASACAKAA
ncbi:hypothetical protein HMSSN139_14170 [Paenibacillus sp. HMSSN-139]|nr:hypothetical protein HMSSN139_14170 [Paenibacillus sp. HMSSN-139]